MAPRIEPAPSDGNPPEVQELLDVASGGSGGTQNIFRTLARHPGLLRQWLPFGGKLLLSGKLPPRERELLILRTAWLCGSDYEWGQHVRIGSHAGLTDEEIARIPAGATDAAWAPQDAVLLRAADQLVADHDLDQPTWDELTTRFDERQLIELPLLVGHYAMLAGFLNSVRVEREDGVPGFPGGGSETG